MMKLKYSDGTESSTTTTSGGLNFIGALTLLFIGLKLTGYIAWPWLWVLSPLWVPLAVAIVLVAIVGTVALFLKWCSNG